jgi:alkanesulfonate monooxygenase SsuD/methylene tetrahydromethanopterin reductase-like flavin-dependent oxidoreductase (luciferase family)
VRVDVLLDPFGARWADFRDGALAAADAGFDGVWTWDHLAGSVHGAPSVLESWTALSALAAVVPTVTLGPLVLNVANRDPGTLAVMAATLQEISGGRLLLGIGAGGGGDTPYGREQLAFGRPLGDDPSRRAAVEHAIGVLRRTWTGEIGGVRGFGRPDPPPPIVVGAFGPKMAELAGRAGDGINTQAGHPRLAELAAIARQAHAGAGHDPDRFLVTAFAGMARQWLAPDGPARSRLAEQRVDRLILLVSPPYSAEITAAGRLLATPG